MCARDGVRQGSADCVGAHPAGQGRVPPSLRAAPMHAGAARRVPVTLPVQSLRSPALRRAALARALVPAPPTHPPTHPSPIPASSTACHRPPPVLAPIPSLPPLSLRPAAQCRPPAQRIPTAVSRGSGLLLSDDCAAVEDFFRRHAHARTHARSGGLLPQTDAHARTHALARIDQCAHTRAPPMRTAGYSWVLTGTPDIRARCSCAAHSGLVRARSGARSTGACGGGGGAVTV